MDHLKYLKYDTHLRYGSNEHYFHFLWGYLLPALHYMLDAKNDQEINNSSFVFESCGPLMDPVIKEALGIFGLSARIVPKDQFKPAIQDQVIIPRWDIYLLRDYILNIDPSDHPLTNNMKSCVYLKGYLEISGFTKKFQEDILQMKMAFLDRIQTSDVIEENEHSFVLTRSERPKFYSFWGKAERKGYGKSRRSLRDVEDFVDQLNSEGVPISSYEPGGHSLRHQISSFKRARCVIGLKGAEFANML
jgi:hypothetical protein